MGSIKIAATEYLLNAVSDVPDARDWVYRPSLQTLKPALLPGDLEILNQESEGACTGFGLAAVINQLNAKQEHDYKVSARMLYEMAKKHDDWPGENYAGSSCRGAIKGWYNMGVCRDTEWPYISNRPGSLTVARAKSARETSIGAYYRIGKRLADFHSALNESGVIFCSANVHKGWSKPSTTSGKIRLTSDMMGGHAFAIVGYDREGFWIQNSWGETWGKKGLGHWSYEDWSANIRDAWVVGLALSTPQVWHQSNVVHSVTREGLCMKPRPTRNIIKGHFVHVDDGHFHEQGRYWSDHNDTKITANLVANSNKYQHLMFYAHGGLNSPDASARRIAAMVDTFKANKIYPYHYMYDTGLMEELKDVIFRKKEPVEGRVGSFSDMKDEVLEWLTRIPGRALWREMKQGARSPFFRNNAGTKTLKAFLQAFSESKSEPQTINLVGHSTGAILLARLLIALQKQAPKLRIASCTLYAPACHMDLFDKIYKPMLLSKSNTFGIDKLNLFILTDELEQDDSVGPYNKSLLYLVSQAFEEDLPAPILGMKKFADGLKNDPQLQALGKRFNVHVSNGKGDRYTVSQTHGGFDNDPVTLNRLLRDILNKRPVKYFDDSIKDFCQ